LCTGDLGQPSQRVIQQRGRQCGDSTGTGRSEPVALSGFGDDSALQPGPGHRGATRGRCRTSFGAGRVRRTSGVESRICARRSGRVEECARLGGQQRRAHRQADRPDQCLGQGDSRPCVAARDAHHHVRTRDRCRVNHDSTRWNRVGCRWHCRRHPPVDLVEVRSRNSRPSGRVQLARCRSAIRQAAEEERRENLERTL
jgi:hypothetical protein